MKSKLKELWRHWVKVSKKIGDFQARLILSLVYLLMIVPAGLIARMFSDPLARKKSGSSWVPRQSSPPRIEDARRQF